MYQRTPGRSVLLGLFILAFAFTHSSSTLAQPPGLSISGTPLTPQSTFDLPAPKGPPGSPKGQGMVGVVVKLKGEPLVRYRGGLAGLAPTNPRVAGAVRLDAKSSGSQAYLKFLRARQDSFEASALRAIPLGRIIHRFDVILNAVSMQVPADQVSALRQLPDVEAVYPDELRQPDTENSPSFIGAPTLWNQLGGQASAGQGVIVGVLDTGIWPEHPSFSDPDPGGSPYPTPPGGPYACDFGNTAVNPSDAPFTCNNKLIGAHRFMSAYEGVIGLLPGEFASARDDNGHGTHTASTSGGNGGVAASIFGVPRGTISGIAPRAHVIAYKVCGAFGCMNSDSAAAVQQAILDGVDVINFSISGGSNPYSDVVELAFLDAYDAGVFVAASAGNSGPSPETVNHRGPWVTTVAASTQNRAFENAVSVTADGGASLNLSGTSITEGISASKAVVVPGSDVLCLGPFAPGTFTDQIVVCQRGGPSRTQKGFNVLQGGAAGMILYNQSASVTDVETDNHFLPTSQIQFSDGQALLTFIGANTNVQATMTAGAATAGAGDVMASFSSRGGPAQTLGVSKPDITAPGLQVLAGHTPLSADVTTGPTGELFQAIAGTSMSSPHIAGSGALLKALHPSWTPGQIKSALMTTALSAVLKEDGLTPATPFDCGSGRVDLTQAGSAGLTFDESGLNYQAREADLWNANYPSVYLPVMPGVMTVQRTAHSELSKTSKWKTIVESPPDVTVTVPKKIKVPAGGDATFPITIDARAVPLGEVRHAAVILQYGKKKTGYQYLRIPISLVRGQPVVPLAKTCTPGTILRKETTDCTISMTNFGFQDANVSLTDTMPKGLKLVKGSVAGGVQSKKTVTFDGSLLAATPPGVAIGAGTTPYGYFPLSFFGVLPIAGMGDETIANYSVPSFTFAGETYTALGVVSNGYVVLGGGTGADVQFLNQSLPNGARPNNVLAPFWTDLNPSAGGAVRIAVLTDGSDDWIVVDWEGVRELSSTNTVSFQIWIGVDSDTNPGEDIAFVYDTIQGNGNGGLLTVGAENRYGNRGANHYYNGVGTLPALGTELRVTGTAPAPGGSHTITYSAVGKKVGQWTNCAEMTSDVFEGVHTACFTGQTDNP